METTLLKKECPFCGSSFSTFQMGRKHIHRIHQLSVTPRNIRDRNNDTLAFNETNVKKYPNASIAYACLSCSQSFAEKQQLASHIMELHIVSDNVPQPELPSETKRWVIGEHDLSQKFYEFRTRCSHLGEYQIDKQFNELLSMSGVLVLQKRFDYQSLPDDLFPPTLLQEMRQDMLKQHYQADPFNPQQMVQVKKILADLVNGIINEDKARMQLLDLCEALNDYERGVIRAIVGLIPEIYDCDMKSLSEMHFTASYIHPFISGLFSSKQPSKIAHCSNFVADEHETANNNRPDYKVDVYNAYQYAYTNVYGEVKPSKNISSSLLAHDFCRVAVFCKDACDQLKLDHVIGFQVTGPTIIWFVMHLKYDKVYTFTEITAIDIPMKKSELLNLVGRLDDLVLLIKIHKTLCCPVATSIDNLRCPTHSTWYTGDFTQTSNKKRKASFPLGN